MKHLVEHSNSRTSPIRRVGFEELAGAPTIGLACGVLGSAPSTMIWCAAGRCESDMVVPRDRLTERIEAQC